MGGVLHIAYDVARREPHEIQKAKTLMNVNVLEGNSFALIAVEDCAWCFLMHMDDFSFRRIVEFLAGVHHTRSPLQILQAGQGLIIGVLKRQTAPHRGIGVIAKWALLVLLDIIRIPTGENLPLRVL